MRKTVHTHKDQDQNYVIQASELHECMFPGSPLLHLDNDKWKCTSFTYKLSYFINSLGQNHTCKMVENVLICALFDRSSLIEYQI